MGEMEAYCRWEREEALVGEAETLCAMECRKVRAPAGLADWERAAWAEGVAQYWAGVQSGNYDYDPS